MNNLNTISILWVEDSVEDMEICRHYIEKAGYSPSITRVETAESFRERLESSDWDIILCDYHLPSFSGPEALDILASSDREIPLVIVTGAVGEEAAVKTLLKGADNYVLKDNLLRLGPAVGQALEKRDLIRKKRAAECALDGSVQRMLDQGRFYEKVLDSTSAFLVIIDTGGRIVRWNRAAERLSGYKEAEFRDVPELKERLFPDPDDRQRVGTWISQVIEKKSLLNDFQISITCRDGSRMPIAFTINYLEEGESGFEGVICLGVDISQYKVLEAQFRTAQKMETIGILAGGIAHDFNNMLAAIIGNTEILMMGKESAKKSYQRFKSIHETSERGATLVRQLMDFSRSREGSVEIIDPAPLAEDLVKLARSALPSSIIIEDSIEADLLSLRADPVHLYQVAMNLIVNAGQAMPHGGILDLSCKNVDLDDESAKAYPGVEPGRYVLFSVSDNGCGMDAETQKKIFDPFFTTKEKGQGTGLGLSTVDGIIKSYEGFISFKSSPGHGTTFDVYLPALPSNGNDVEVSPASLEGLPSGSETVLLVDDEDIVLEIHCSMLKELGYEVVTAKDGIEALKIMERQGESMALVITDMAMPQMHGIDLIQKATELYPDMPIIAISGLADSDNVNAAYRSGAKAFLAKPCSLGDLAEGVRKAIDSPALSKD